MLNLDMGLDADLGIDSIKRVEILSAVQERLPRCRAVAADQLGTLRTLADVATALSPAKSNGVAKPLNVATPTKAADLSPVVDAELGDLLLKIVADKTGYPVEMLNLEMGLDADLGIDSIKRVEILSSLQEAVAEFDAARRRPPRRLADSRRRRRGVSANDSCVRSSTSEESGRVADAGRR